MHMFKIIGQKNTLSVQSFSGFYSIHSCINKLFETDRLNKEIEKTKGYIRKTYQNRLDGIINDALWKDRNTKYQESLELLQEKSNSIAKADKSFYQQAEDLINLPESLNSGWLNALKTAQIRNGGA